jgi:hypothetical protein
MAMATTAGVDLTRFLPTLKRRPRGFDSTKPGLSDSARRQLLHDSSPVTNKHTHFRWPGAFSLFPLSTCLRFLPHYCNINYHVHVVNNIVYHILPIPPPFIGSLVHLASFLGIIYFRVCTLVHNHIPYLPYCLTRDVCICTH